MPATLNDEYTEGWTAPIEYWLQHDGVSFNATGMTPSIVLKDRDGNAVVVSGTVEWADALTSKIRFNPANTDFIASKSPYKLRWKVTDGSGKVAYYPQGNPILIQIYPQ